MGLFDKMSRGGSRGRVHTLPWYDLRFSKTTGILQKRKKNYVVIGVKVEQETSAPPPKKNPGSAPDVNSLEPFEKVKK